MWASYTCQASSTSLFLSLFLILPLPLEFRQIEFTYDANAVVVAGCRQLNAKNHPEYISCQLTSES